MAEKGESTFARVSESLDLLGEKHYIAISSEKQQINSGLGAFCTVLILIVVSLFTYQKAEILISNKEMRLVEFTMKNYYDGSEFFTEQDGLAIAFATPDVIDPTYYTVQAGYMHWGYSETEGFYSSVEPIQTHQCSLEELGISKSDGDKS